MTPPYCHRNRMNVAYYLHRGTTKTGKPRYFFAKTVGEGAIAEVPVGYEVAESVNGVVSLRKAVASSIPVADVALVREALAHHELLRACMVEAKADAIVIHEPERGGFRGDDDIAALARELGVPAARVRRHLAAQAQKARYVPIMKFEPAFVGSKGEYLAYRRTYRGDGGWLALSTGKLPALLAKYLPHIGRESFFDLM